MNPRAVASRRKVLWLEQDAEMLSRISEMFRRFPTGPVPPSDGSTYSFKPSLAGHARTFALTGDDLVSEGFGKPARWHLQSIAQIRLSYRPISIQSRRYRADIANDAGSHVTLYSTTWQTASLMSRQDDSYRAFIVELHKRLAAINSRAILTAGIGRKSYLAGLAAMALVGIGIAALLLRALWIGEFVGALFLLGFAALFAWQIGGFMKRNRPRSYTLDALPLDVLP